MWTDESEHIRAKLRFVECKRVVVEKVVWMCMTSDERVGRCTNDYFFFSLPLPINNLDWNLGQN